MTGRLNASMKSLLRIDAPTAINKEFLTREIREVAKKYTAPAMSLGLPDRWRGLIQQFS